MPNSTHTRMESLGKSAALKRSFDIEEAVSRLREAVAPYPKAALLELAAEGYTSVFEQLTACILSMGTR
jgi:endonuclease-3